MSLDYPAIETSFSLLPKISNPFFIVSPPLARISAGVTVLHLLCHYLNRLGEAAYMVHYPVDSVPIRTLPNYASLQGQGDLNPAINAPHITQQIIDFYDNKNITPIVIYPEVFDNPFKVSFFGRYILNYPGKLNAAYTEKEAFSIAYSESLAKHCEMTYPDRPRPMSTLFLPTCDLDYWKPDPSSRRDHGCYYAGKLKQIIGGNPEGIPDNCVEIERATEMTTERVREIFQHSNVFYCYEDTALAIEAMLCGCPTLFVPNDHFSGVPLAAHELGDAGWCISTEPNGLFQASKSVGQFRTRVEASISAVPAAIAAFAANAKRHVEEVSYDGTILYPYEPKMVLFDKLAVTSGLQHDEADLTAKDTDQNDHPVDDEGYNYISPEVSLRPDVIRRIATEVWFERQRWGLPYKISKWVRRRFSKAGK